MSNTKFTSGPWTVVSEKNDRIEYLVNDSNGHHVATFDGRYGAKESENKANATLAAASTELLELLKIAVLHVDGQLHRHLKAKINAAIKSATE